MDHPTAGIRTGRVAIVSEIGAGTGWEEDHLGTEPFAVSVRESVVRAALMPGRRIPHGRAPFRAAFSPAVECGLLWGELGFPGVSNIAFYILPFRDENGSGRGGEGIGFLRRSQIVIHKGFALGGRAIRRKRIPGGLFLDIGTAKCRIISHIRMQQAHDLDVLPIFLQVIGDAPVDPQNPSIRGLIEAARRREALVVIPGIHHHAQRDPLYIGETGISYAITRLSKEGNENRGNDEQDAEGNQAIEEFNAVKSGNSVYATLHKAPPDGVAAIAPNGKEGGAMNAPPLKWIKWR